MKPLFLQFSGLNSYREVQTVDFTQLLGGGLFGIFGPTGSGKSTVLDAITLALYGTVERARRNTEGIINQAEKAVGVKFSFVLVDARGEVKYRVERSYKRDAEGAVRSSHARLVEGEAAAERVLADKDRWVTEEVERILGLTVEDFTRAVVLPQGKFAEFLHLEGVKRRGMLERIFALGQYGDQLNQRLKVQTEAADRQFRETMAHQEGLGDASEAAVGKAQERVEAAEALVGKAQRDLVAAEATWREWQRVWDLQQELTAVHADLANWQERAAEVEAQRAEQVAATRAEQVRPALDEQAEADRRVATARVKLSSATEALRAVAEAEAVAVAAHRAAQTQRETEAPRLAERRVRLEQALALESEVATLTAEATDLANRVALGRTETEKLTREIDALADGGERVRTAQAAVVAHMGELDIPADRRALVQRGLLALGNLRQAQDRLSQAAERVAVRERELAAAYAQAGMAKDVEGAAHARVEAHESAQRTLEANPPDQEADLAANDAWLARTEAAVQAVQEQDRLGNEARAAAVTAAAERDRTVAALAAAEQAESAARARLDVARTRRAKAEVQLEDMRRLDHAAALVGVLVEGQPCPVCGSPAHPHPAAAATTAGTDVAAAQVEYETATQALRATETAYEGAAQGAGEARTAAQVAETRVKAAEESLDKAGAALTQARTALPQAWGNPAARQLPALLQAQVQEQKLRRQRFETWRQRVEEARKHRDDLTKAHARAAADMAAADAKAAGALKAKLDADADRAAAEAVLRDRTAEFALAGDGLGAAALEAEDRRIAGADKEMTRLRGLLATHGEDLRTLEEDLKQKREQHQKYAQALQKREQDHAAARERLDSQTRLLAERAGGSAAAPQLAAVQADLARLDAREAAAARASEETGQRRAEAGAALAAARREDELASERVAHARETLLGALTLAGFANGTAAAAALRTPERLAALETWLRTYDQEGDRLTARSATLSNQLKGRSLTTAEWAARTGERDQAQTNLDLVKEERTRATQVCEDLTAKQAQWRELEQTRKTLESDLSYLTELQRLLRGNTFVEFLAEEQMEQVARAASERLGELTRYRYALEVDSAGGFVIADNGNGGLKRPVTTLSGGETFLTSLALSLALSAQIQLRGTYPLEFFFLDEGFGTLDPDLLNTVIDSLERLHYQNLHVGVISHVPELRNRLQRRLIVEPAEPGGHGSQLRLELA